MIEVKDLRKAYTTGSFTQKALDGVSITFRENEFVAILGPSGSGKTTLLNVLGGLDHADTGDIVVNGVSTHDYKSADWDTYRNHHIGFIFQSYNLIPHQSVLSNVELALTLAGTTRESRRERARKALDRVGLGQHANKRPSQLSGGQAQRVAIARALVNEPDIVLADEPTGALDTETGHQVMDLLSEIASDRLVIMVTHNPELAYQYANRIVKLEDGRIVDDSAPVTEEEREAAAAGFAVPAAAAAAEGAAPGEAPAAPADAATGSATDAATATGTGAARRANASKGSKKHASMSFLTALSLSFSNLMTKKGRTFLTAFAGSIGIIGIATILALSNGVNNYIAQVEEETLSSYPLTITKSSFDLTAMMSPTSAQGGEAATEEGKNLAEGTIPERTIVSDMFADIKNNDLKSFKKWLDGDGKYVSDYTNGIAYRYGISPQIYTNKKKPQQVNPSPMEQYNGSDELGSLMSSMSSMSQASSFTEMIDNPQLLDAQFEVVKGKWPEKYNEAVLVLNSRGAISDYTLYNLGVLDPDEFLKMYKKAMNEEKVKVPNSQTDFTYDDALNLTFKVVDNSALYRYNASQKVWTDMSDDKKFVKNAVSKGTTLKIVGVVKARETATTTLLTEGVAYTHGLTTHLLKNAAKSQIVKEQLAHPKTDVFTGKTFKALKKDSGFDMESLFTVDEAALRAALSTSGSGGMDFGGIDMSKLGNAIDMKKLQKAMKDIPQPTMTESKDFSLSAAQQAQMSQVVSQLMIGFFAYYQQQHAGEPITQDTDFSADFQAYLQTPAVQAQMQSMMQGMTSSMGTDMAKKTQDAMQDYMTNTVQPYLQQVMAQTLQDAAQQMAKEMMASMSVVVAQSMQSQMTAMSNNLASALQSSIHFNLDKDDLAQLMSSMLSGSKISYEGNLTKLGYAKENDPSSISLYPKDFDNKELVLQAIDQYNSEQTAKGNEDGTISYSDVMGVLISSVTDIINMISMVLIAFVSVSLVVSSIMIGIITYISVLERRKEIGILRAMGASKGNVASIFNAETVIEGLIAGVIAIALVMLVSFPVNAIVLEGFKVPNIMALPWESGLILIGISVLLTFIAGLIPSVSASRKDPVEALRSE